MSFNAIQAQKAKLTDPRDIALKEKIDNAFRKASGNEKVINEISDKVFQFEMERAIILETKCPDRLDSLHREMNDFIKKYL